MEQRYTFFLLEGSSTPSAFEVDYCTSVEAAINKAERLLAERPRYDVVEVSDGEISQLVKRSSPR